MCDLAFQHQISTGIQRSRRPLFPHFLSFSLSFSLKPVSSAYLPLNNNTSITTFLYEYYYYYYYFVLILFLSFVNNYSDLTDRAMPVKEKC